MRFDGDVEDFAQHVEADVPNPDELQHAGEQVTELSKDLVGGQPPAPIHLVQTYQGVVLDVDRETYRATIDAHLPEGPIKGVRYGRTHPKVDDEYPVFVPTTGTEPWIEVPEQQEGNWLYWMTIKIDDDTWCCVRAPWPPIDEHPDIQLVIHDLPFNFVLYGVDGDGGVWVGERGLTFGTEHPIPLFRYKNYGFDDAPDEHTIPSRWVFCRVDNSPVSHSDPTKGSSSIIARETVQRDDPDAYIDLSRETQPLDPPSWIPLLGPFGAPNRGIAIPGGPYGGFGGWLVMRAHNWVWPDTIYNPWLIPHQHGGFVDIVFYGRKAGIPGAHPADTPCCSQEMTRGGINPTYWVPDHAHGPSADYPGIQPNNSPDPVHYFDTGDPLWRQWEEKETHIHWELFDANGGVIPYDAPGGGILGPGVDPNNPANLGGRDPHEGETHQAMNWTEWRFHTRDKEDDWTEVYRYDNKDTLIPKELLFVHVQGGSPVSYLGENGVEHIPGGGYGYYPGPPPPPVAHDANTVASLYRCDGTCAHAAGGDGGNDGPAPSGLDPTDPYYDPNNHTPPIIVVAGYNLTNFHGRAHELLDRTRMWTDAHGERKYAIVMQQYANPDNAFGRLVFNSNNGWHYQQQIDSTGNYVPAGVSDLFLCYPVLNIRAEQVGFEPLVVYGTAPDNTNHTISAIAKFITARGSSDPSNMPVRIADDVTTSWPTFDAFSFGDLIDQTWDMGHMLAIDTEGSIWYGGYKYHYTIDRGATWHQVGWHQPSSLPYNDQYGRLFSSDPRFTPAFIVIMPTG